MTERSQIRAIVFQDGDHWVAQCLEHDIGAQGPDLETLRDRLTAVIAVELRESMERSGTPFAGIEPAPQHFHDMWDRRSGSYQPTRPATVRDHGQEFGVELALCA